MKENNEEFDKWMMDYMAGSLSGEDMQKFHTLLKSDIHYRNRFKDLSAIHAKLLIPRFAAEEADNYEKLLRRINLKKSTSSRHSSPHRITWKSIRRIAAVIALLITSSIACYYVWMMCGELPRMLCCVKWRCRWAHKQMSCCLMAQWSI